MAGHPIAPARTTAVASLQPFGSRGPASPGQFIPSVMAAFAQFSAALEDRVTFAYQDSRPEHFVTTGVGYLIDPIETALPPVIPWQIDGRAATIEEVREQWRLVKENIDPKLMSVGAQKIPGNTMRLTYADVDVLTTKRANGMVSALARYFPNVLQWPADAQLGLLGVTWGTGANLPRVSFMADFVVALKADDFPTMATTAHWANITRDRRAELQRLFTNAEYVLEQGGDYTTLNWPVTLSVTRIAVGGKAC
jgi:hypothetical protein